MVNQVVQFRDLFYYAYLDTSKIEDLVFHSKYDLIKIVEMIDYVDRCIPILVPKVQYGKRLPQNCAEI